MASIVVSGDTSGAITIAAPAVAGTNTLTLPASTGTLVVTGGAQTIEFADGSASAPSITNSGDTNTGMFFPAADTIAFTEGGTESMRIDSSGNVGIGTSSPNAKLQVVGNVMASNGTASTPAYHFVGSSAIGMFTPDAGFSVAFSTNSTERMRIDSSGNVGIGLTSSGNKFEVSGSGLFTGAVTTNTTGTHISYQSSNSQIGAWGPDTSTNGTLVFYSARSNGVNGLERMRIDSNGNLIMASGAGYLGLPTNQTMRIPSTGGISYVGNINSATVFQIAYNSTSSGVQLSSGATSWGTFSDSRLKNITGTYTNALNDIAQIQPVKFTWKADKDSKPQVGVIAQSIQNVVPEAVDSTTIEMDGTEEYLTVRYTELIPLMIAAIQEQQQIINDLKARIETLEGAK